MRGKDFAELVHKIIFGEKRFEGADVAARMGLGYDAFYARATNRVTFTAEEIRTLVSVAPDPRFVTYLLRGTSFVAADRCVDCDSETDAIHRGATRIVIEAADVLEAVEDALRDGHIDHRDALDIAAEIEVAERALATLRLRVRNAAPARVAEKI